MTPVDIHEINARLRRAPEKQTLRVSEMGGIRSIATFLGEGVQMSPLKAAPQCPLVVLDSREVVR